MPIRSTKRRNLEQDRARRVISRFEEGSDPRSLSIAVQESLGFVPSVALCEISKKSGCSEAEVLALVESDTTLLREPRGHHRVTICTGTTCAPRGGASMVRMARRLLGINLFRTTADDTIRLDSQKCLGRCAMAPNVQIDGTLFGAMDEKRFRLLLSVMGSKRRGE